MSTFENGIWLELPLLQGEIVSLDSEFYFKASLFQLPLADGLLGGLVPGLVEGEDGVPGYEWLIGAGQPLTIKVSDELTGLSVQGAWEDGFTRTIELDQKGGCGFRMRKDGTGIGISDVRDSGFRVFYINLACTPVSFEKNTNGRLQLRFADDNSCFYIPPYLKFG